MNSLKKIQVSNNSLLNWVLQSKDNFNDLPFYTKDMFCNHLEVAYSNQETTSCNSKINTQKFKVSDYKQYPVIKEISSLINENSELFLHFFLHGSFGDMKISKGWSDFDSMAVITKESLDYNNRNKMLDVSKKIDKLMRNIDPYQHHGIHFIHENEMSSYPNLYMPINLFEDSKCLTGKEHFYYSRIDSKNYEINRIYGILKTLKHAGQTGILNHHPKNNVYLLEDYENISTMYQLKYFLCVIMLLPTLWINCFDNYCKKSDSFSIIKKYFNEKDLELLNKASMIRETWGTKSNNSENNKIPIWLMNILGGQYLKRGEILATRFESELNRRL